MAKRTRSVGEYELADVSMRSGPAAAAGRARELLAADRLPEDTTRTELLIELSDYLEMSGDVEAAEVVIREAIASGGRAWSDPRIRLADLVARRGDRASAETLLADVWKERPSDAWDYLAAAEVLEEWGDLTAALRWVNTGAFRGLRIEERPTGDTLMLLARRRRLRADMGFTEDDYDLLAAEAQSGLDDDLDRYEDLP